MLYPDLTICLLCGGSVAAADSLCAPCLADLPHRQGGCRICARPCPDAVCGPCTLNPPPYDRVVAPFPYRYPVDALIKAAKYGGRMEWLPPLTEALAAAAGAAIDPDDRPWLLPVPLHWRRQFFRGFNQAAEIARLLGKSLDLQVAARALHRKRPTASQAGLAARDRRRNVRAAFAVRHLADREYVAIVDDVITTGATVTELSLLLKKAGVRRVEVWALAAADGPRGR